MSLITILVAAGAFGLLCLLLADMRELVAPADAPYVWRFLRRRGVRRRSLVARMGEPGVRAVELRCTACPSHGGCAARLAQGAAEPLAGCPNAALFR
jgi:hypothetical protein